MNLQSTSAAPDCVSRKTVMCHMWQRQSLSLLIQQESADIWTVAALSFLPLREEEKHSFYHGNFPRCSSVATKSATLLPEMKGLWPF